LFLGEVGVGVVGVEVVVEPGDAVVGVELTGAVDVGVVDEEIEVLDEVGAAEARSPTPRVRLIPTRLPTARIPNLLICCPFAVWKHGKRPETLPP
jgi:hypothetical protein